MIGSHSFDVKSFENNAFQSWFNHSLSETLALAGLRHVQHFQGGNGGEQCGKRIAEVEITSVRKSDKE